jgi:hypothetical protein
MDAFEIRSATPADADAVAAYHHRCFLKSYSPQLLAGEFQPPDDAGMSRSAPTVSFTYSSTQTIPAPVSGDGCSCSARPRSPPAAVEHGISDDERVLTKYGT